MSSSFFVLGPSLGNVYERGALDISVAQVAGRRGISFQDIPTKPGGNVCVKLNPPLNPGDTLPLNVYAFFVQPVSSVPVGDGLTTDWFFKSGSPSGSIHVGAADPNGCLVVAVPGVQPSLQPYFVQTVLEYTP